MQYMTITPDELAEIVRHTIAQNAGFERENPAQAAVDRCVQVCYEAGEIELAMAIIVVSAARVAGESHSMLGVIMQHVADRQ